MSTLLLFAISGFLLGHLLVGYATGMVWSLVLLGGAGSIALGVLIRRWLGGACLLFLASLVLGQHMAGESVEEWQSLPAVVNFAGETIVIKRESAKTWYQPVVLRPLDRGVAAADILWQAPRTLTLVPGDRVELTCALARPTNFDSRFDYATYLATRGIGFICERADEHALILDDGHWRHRLFVLQAAIRSRITGLVPEPAAGLLQGLFLGGDETLPQTLRDAFRRAGLSHIVAVSGYNMTLIAFATLFAALSLGLWRKTATALAMLGILGFLLIIDTSAASVRAAIMAWIVFLAYFVGRPASALNGLSLAACLMTIINPLIVRYDIGFQLSFLATLSLIAASPWLDQLSRRAHFLGKLVLIPLATLIIEGFILPVIAFHFGTINWLGPLANTLVLPLVPLAMVLGALFLMASFALPVLAPFFVLPLWLLLMLVVSVAEWVGGLAWSTFEGWYPSAAVLCGWYIVLGAVVWYSRKSLYAYALRMDHPRRTL